MSEVTIDEVLAGRATWAVVCGDAVEVLAGLPETCAHVCYCDPPYGLSEQRTADVIACLAAWMRGEVYTHRRAGFMGNKWDAFVPGPEAWRAVLRALKPGGYCVAFSSTRTVDLLGIAVRLAGFEMRQGWSWIGGQGFPKSLDVSKAIDASEITGGSRPEDLRRVAMGEDYVPSGHGRINYDHGSGSVMNGSATNTAPETASAVQWDGYGTDVKPAVEPIVVARKELDGTVAENVQRHGCGALNIDAARIASGGASPSVARRETAARTGWDGRGGAIMNDRTDPARYAESRSGEQLGRFPAALALVHDEGCEHVGYARVRGDARQGGGTRPGGFGDIGAESGTSQPCAAGHAAPDGTETIDNWLCVEGCPVRVLGEQSGELTSGRMLAHHIDHGKASGSLGAFGGGAIGREFSGGTGTAARFFYQAKASSSDRLVYITCSVGCLIHETVMGVREARASARDQSREHPHGFCRVCGARRDHYQHPTVKPLGLARYHVQLLTLPSYVQPLALVPYCGTGVEARALLDAGFRVIAVDDDPRHVAMARHRLAAHPGTADAPSRPTTAAIEPKKTDAKTAPPTVARYPAAQLTLFGDEPTPARSRR